MKEWQITLLGAIVMFVTGFGMFMWGKSLELSAILSGAYPGYVLVANQFFMTILAGVFFAGLGGGLLISTLLIYQLEKKLD